MKMKDVKEEIIDQLITVLATKFDRGALEDVTQALSIILHHYNIESETMLPSVNIDDTDKIIKRFIATKKLEGCLPNTLRHYRYVITKFAYEIHMDLRNVTTNAIRYYLSVINEKGD